MRESLSTFAAKTKKAIHEDLLAGRTPRVGSFDPELIRQTQVKQPAQMGTTVFLPGSVQFQYIYPDPIGGAALVLTVTVEAPERIVFLPVPEWVVENVWQGSVDGTYHFESDARELLARFTGLLEPSANLALFGPQAAKRRE